MIAGRVSKAEAHRRARALRRSLLDLDDRLDDGDLEGAAALAMGIFEASRTLDYLVREIDRRAKAREEKRQR